MVRVIAFFVGLAFAGVLLISLIMNGIAAIQSPAEATAEHEFHLQPRNVAYSFEGPFGTYDKAQLQRGFQVYKEVCAACHSLHLVAFNDLKGLGYEEPEIKAIADQWAIEVPSVNPDTGEAATRKAIPADKFPSPYANETAARAANNNALPPDLSLIAKAREGGPEYVHALLTGYRAQPAELLKKFPAAATPEGLHYNPYFANLNIAMPPPIVSDGQVTYADGTPATVDQMSKDVGAFLMWTAEPKLENRRAAGMATIIFLLFGTTLGYFAYRNIWADAKRKVRVTGALDPKNQAKSRRAKRKEGVAG
jgi:ubiquinol-cytochrome c reductase cytochrome c1 subunit